MPVVPIRPLNLPAQNIGGITPDAFGAGIARAKQDLGRSKVGAAQSRQRAGRSVQRAGGADSQAGASITAAGRSIQQTGQGFTDLGNTLLDIRIRKQAKADERLAKSSFFEFKAQRQEIENTFSNLNGEAAEAGQAKVLADVDKLGERILEDLFGNERAIEAVRAAIQESNLPFAKRVDTHVSTQNDVVDKSNFEAGVADATAEAVANVATFRAAPPDNTFDELETRRLTRDVEVTRKEDPNSDEAIRAELELETHLSRLKNIIPTDLVRHNEDAIRTLVGDRSRDLGDSKDVRETKIREAVASYYSAVITSLVRSGDADKGLEIFNAKRGVLTGVVGGKIAEFLRSKTTNDAGLAAGRAIFKDSLALPKEERDDFIRDKLNAITDFGKFNIARTIVKENRKEATAIAASQVDTEAVNVVNERVDGGESLDDIAVEAARNPNKDVRTAQLNVIKVMRETRATRDENIAKSIVAVTMLTNGGDVATTKKVIKTQFALGNLTKEQKHIADKHLVDLAKTNAELLKSDVPTIVEARVSQMTEKTTSNIPPGETNEGTRSRTLAEADLNRTKNPEVNSSTIKKINEFFNTRAALVEEQQEAIGRDAAIAGENLEGDGFTVTARLAGREEAARIRKNDEDDEKARVEFALQSALAFTGVDKPPIRPQGEPPIRPQVKSLSDFRDEFPENYETLRANNLLGTVRKSISNQKKDNQSATANDLSVVNSLNTRSQEELANLDAGPFASSLTEEGFNALSTKIAAAKITVKKENKDLFKHVTTRANALQPTEGTGGRRLYDDEQVQVVAENVLVRVSELRDAGEKVDDPRIDNILVTAFIKIKVRDTGIFGLLPFTDSGSGPAGTSIFRESASALESYLSDPGSAPDRFRTISEKLFERRTGGGNPTDAQIDEGVVDLVKQLLVGRGSKQ